MNDSFITAVFFDCAENYSKVFLSKQTGKKVTQVKVDKIHITGSFQDCDGKSSGFTYYVVMAGKDPAE